MAAAADPLPGATREHLHLSLDAAAWQVTFENDGDTATWTYRPATAQPGRMSAESVAVSAFDRALAPFPTRELPQRSHALLAPHAPGLRLDVRRDTPRDGRERLVYVLATGQAGDGAIVGLAVDGLTAVHSAEIELPAAVDAARIDHWVDVFERAVVVPGSAPSTD